MGQGGLWTRPGASRTPATALLGAQRPFASPQPSHRPHAAPCRNCKRLQTPLLAPLRRRGQRCWRRPPLLLSARTEASASSAQPASTSGLEAQRLDVATRVGRAALCAAAVGAWALVSAGRPGSPLLSLTVAANQVSQEGVLESSLWQPCIFYVCSLVQGWKYGCTVCAYVQILH